MKATTKNMTFGWREVYAASAKLRSRGATRKVDTHRMEIQEHNALTRRARRVLASAAIVAPTVYSCRDPRARGYCLAFVYAGEIHIGHLAMTVGEAMKILTVHGSGPGTGGMTFAMNIILDTAKRSPIATRLIATSLRYDDGRRRPAKIGSKKRSG